MKFIILFVSFISWTALASNQEPELIITKLTDNVYQHVSYMKTEQWGMVAASGLVVIDKNDAYIIDTPWSLEDTEKLINWVTSKNLTLKASIVTHFHEDASGGLPVLNGLKIKTYAYTLTNKLLNLANREQSSDDITSDIFELVPGTIEVFYPGAGHSQDNIVIWLPKVNVLFGGCFVKSINSKNLGNLSDASVKGWPNSINKVIDKYPSVEIVVPGHGEVGDISLLKHTAQLALAKSALLQ